MSKTFSSLSVPNYRKYFTGLFIANIGGWMSSTAKQWLVLTILTAGDARALGFLTGLMFAPSLLLAPVAAMIADRFPKRTIVMWSQLVTGLDTILITVLTLTGQIRLWHVFALALADGTASALAQPAQQAFVSEVVPRDKLTNAIGLNSAQFNAARLLGPGAAGALIALVGTRFAQLPSVGVVFGLNVAAFGAFVIALRILDTSQLLHFELQRGKGQLREGLRYVRGRPDLKLLLFCGFMMGNFGFNFAISNAVMSTAAFDKGAGEFGALGSIMGIGALVAALLAARRARPRLRHVLLAMAGFAGFSVVSALSPSYLFFSLTLIPIGFSAVMVMVSANSLVQMNVADEFRGRVMTLWTAFSVGGTLVVAPLVGVIGEALGPRATVWFEAISMGITFAIAAGYVMVADNIRVRLDTNGGAPWIYLDRGEITEDLTEAAR